MPSTADTFSVRLPDTTRKQVDRLAALSKRSRSYIINEAVEAYVKDRIAYLEDIERAVASVDATPGHSGEQIFEWMRSWGSATELPSPMPDLKRR
jgi:predicted transcriptional regulator